MKDVSVTLLKLICHTMHTQIFLSICKSRFCCVWPAHRPAGKTLPPTDVSWFTGEPLAVNASLSFIITGFVPRIVLMILSCCVTAPELPGGTIEPVGGFICS